MSPSSEEPSLTGFEFQDVYLIPQYSEVGTRKAVNLSTTVGGFILDVPVISSNMDTVTGSEMAIAMRRAGGIGALHRFLSIEENVRDYLWVAEHTKLEHEGCFVSVGVNRDSKERTQALYDAGARYFVIDIAHGHSLVMAEMIKWMRETYEGRIYIMAGNVATAQGAYALANWGANAIKVGVGPGSVCLTKNVTGVTVPQLGAIQECARTLSAYTRFDDVLLVADGGIREYGDAAKALAAGADLVMAGGLFAGAKEALGGLVGGKKMYRGMASRDAMLAIRFGDDSLPTPEGVSTLVETKGSVGDIVRELAGGLRSSLSYSNAHNIKEFQGRARFGRRNR